MAAYYKSIAIEQGNALLRACIGRRIAHLWRSVDPCIFIEIGRLKKNPPLFRNLSGQITIATESDWRVEKPRSIQFGSGFSDKRIDNLLPSLIGTRIISLEILGRLPELRIELDDSRVISTFTNWSNNPRWLIGFKDTNLFNLHSIPSKLDIEPWMHVKRGCLEIVYCYDDTNPAERQFIHKLSHS
jgi:hypothetical protein